MCGRCSSLHGAVALAARPPGREVMRIDPAQARAWDAALIVFGMIGRSLELAARLCATSTPRGWDRAWPSRSLRSR
jgi:hypothetical protein